MMTILWESYRLLVAKKMFWVVLAISVLIAGTYASVGFVPEGISVLFGAHVIESELLNADSPVAEYVYLTVFTDMLVPFWLGLFALVLALISVSSVFPDFLKGGSVDVAVSKPVSRVTLFLVKYLGCLLFVAIQVLIFCVIVFFAHGTRMGSWNYGIFWAVPLLTFVFSLIYCIAVLTAVWTRSTMFSLLMALLVWGVTLGVQWGESMLYKFTYVLPSVGVSIDMEKGTSDLAPEAHDPDDGMVQFYQAVKTMGWPLPKTREATYMLKKKITVDGGNLTEMTRFLEAGASEREKREARAQEDYANRHSDAYVIGSSLVFEACVLGLACFLFVRKDY
ncbi:ABC transporter permease [Verrucomicrobiaceae bacterium N1E253]|uniref:ABC transporter permease n=1 Tax=Oceaniferula marina TaxID=2748318 RepID=A0A851GNC6_9BACT|nr:ABC transporter permease [Oceaniferula marina]NWK56635.1 ABC transporter permease [Oceaniferula marina]